MRKQLSAVEAGEPVDEFKKAINILTALHIIKRACWLVKPVALKIGSEM